MPPSRKKSRSILVNAVGVVIGFALLGLAVNSNRAKLREVFERQVDFRLFALAIGIYLVALGATFFRWLLLVRAAGISFRPADAIRLGFIGNVFNLVIPGAVGGDVIKAVFLARAQPDRKAGAVASMVIDRVVGLAGLFLLAGVAGLFALGRANAQVKALIGLVWLLLAIGLSGLAVLFTPRLYPLLRRLTGARPKLAKVLADLEAAALAYRARIGLVAGLLVGSSLIHATYVCAFYVVSRAILDDLPSFAEHFLIVPMVLFTTAVPLPFGALGLSENASGLLFGLGGGPGGASAAAANGAVAMMGFRTIMYAGGLVSLVVYLANLGWVRELTKPVGIAPDPAGLPTVDPA